jgi:hypothetical protein
MLNQIPQFFLILIAFEEPDPPCGAEGAPPCGPAPPNGDQLPIDSATWVLIVAALLIAGYHFYKIWKSSRITD